MLKTNQVMVPHSAPSFLEVTRPLFLLPLVKMNIILSTFRTVIFTTMSDVPTKMVSPSLAFLQFLKVIFYLVMLSSNHEHKDTLEFCKFRHSLFHGSLCQIFETLHPAMSMPEVVRFRDGHFCRVIYGFGPYIADYLEQVLLACIVQGWCGRYVHLFAI